VVPMYGLSAAAIAAGIVGGVALITWLLRRRRAR
jgi:hypothetical protein